jgi:hypothetical protein
MDKLKLQQIIREEIRNVLNEKKEVTISLRYARQANDVFDDMYKRIGKKEYTDTFSFKSKEDANDFIESLVKVGIPENEIDESTN